VTNLQKVISIPGVADAKYLEINDAVFSEIWADMDCLSYLTLFCVKGVCKYLSSYVLFQMNFQRRDMILPP
jgi:hypothetical protein